MPPLICRDISKFLLKIIAGLEEKFQGEVVFSPGYSVGYLAQEPHLDDEKTVRQIVEEGVQETMNILKEYEEVNLFKHETYRDVLISPVSNHLST